MRILRFDSVGGASGDMILGALVGLGVDPDVLTREIRAIIPHDPFCFKIEPKSSFGVNGLHLTVELSDARDSGCDHDCGCDHVHDHDHDHDHDRDHDHDCGHDHEHGRDVASVYGHDGGRAHEHGRHSHSRTYASIRDMLESSALEERGKRDALAAFAALAKAEAEAHDKPIDEVHFHEVGAVDSIIDTVGSALGLSLLGVEAISLSPLPVGEGTFRCAHGVYPLPAPATAILLRDYGLPTSGDVERCEMLTPTATSLFAVWKKCEIPSGAKLVAVANSFGTREMKTRPNLLRASLYEIPDAPTPAKYCEDTLFELETNVDDATGERLADVAAVLFELGALDVWFESIFMKKGRPAAKLCALVRESERDAALDAIFRHSGVFGVRETVKRRLSLARRWEEVETSRGVVRVKIGGTLDGEILSETPEFEDCRRLARDADVACETIARETMRRYAEKKDDD